MTFKSGFPPPAQKYIEDHSDEWPSVLAYKVGVLYNYPCTARGVREQIKKIKSNSLL